MPKLTPKTGNAKATGLLPDFYVDHVTDIQPALLQQLGVRYLLLDVDHTLAALNASQLDRQTVDFLRCLVRDDVVDGLYIVSNSRRDLRRIADSIGATVIRPNPWQRKPSRAYYRKVLRVVRCQPQQAMMVGDKLFNDILGGNRSGLYTMLVEPIGPAQWLDRLLGRRFWGSRYIRRHRQRSHR